MCVDPLAVNREKMGEDCLQTTVFDSLNSHKRCTISAFIGCISKLSGPPLCRLSRLYVASPLCRLPPVSPLLISLSLGPLYFRNSARGDKSPSVCLPFGVDDVYYVCMCFGISVKMFPFSSFSHNRKGVLDSKSAAQRSFWGCC